MAWTSVLESVFQDLRYGLRGLRRAPGFAATAILTFALGIGLAASMFAVVDSVLFEPLPFRDAAGLVRLTTTIPATAAGQPSRTMAGVISVAELLELRARSRAVPEAGVYRNDFRTLTGASSTTRLEGWRVEPVLLEMLGTSPLLGRVFWPGERDVILLSEGTWRDQFGGARDVIGKSILLDGHTTTVVGVMSAAFEFPFELSNRQFWLPLQLETTDPGDLRVRLPMVARLADGVSHEAATAEVNTILRATVGAGNSYDLVRLQDEIVAPVRRGLIVLMIGVGGVLLIACVNVASLLVSRGAVRERELAVRLALGASRARVVRQLATEGVLLALVGASAGIGLATAALTLVRPLAATLTRMDVGRLTTFPRLSEVALDGSVVLVAIATSVLAGIALGLVPALRVIALPSRSALHSRASADGSELGLGRPGTLRPLLVIAEIAMATILIIGSALLFKSFVTLATRPLGYEPDRVLTFQVATPEDRYEGARIQAFADDLVSRLKTLPDVESAAYAPLLPMVTLLQDTAGFRRTPRPLDNPRVPGEDLRGVSQDYFRTMGIRVIAGRGFNDDDRPGSSRVLVINRALARRDFEGENPIGQDVYMAKDTQPWRIVGVVEDVRQKSLDQDPAPQVFISLHQSPMALGMRFLQYYAVRTPGDPLALVSRVRDVLRGMDSDAALYHVAPMDALVANSVSRPRLYAVLAAVGSGVALVLAAVGIYGVIAYLVAARTREFGIRIALGASPFGVCRIVLGRGLVLTAIGLSIGLGGAALSVRSLEGMLFGLSPLDPATFVAAALLFAVVAAGACAVPAVRAIRIDPAVALRSE